jgi:hypothetical protein
MDQLSVQYEWFDEGYMDDGSRPMHPCFFLLLGHSKRKSGRATETHTLSNTEATEGSDMDDDRRINLGYVYGLILEVVDPELPVYRRIGAFRHVWDDRRTTMDNPKPEDYPEFLDFDPDNFERHTVTII